jgi:hypothetical protein
MMDESDWLAERFEEHRSHFRAVAYRMLGSVSEADDAVQEAWLRLSRADTSSVENLGGWLTRVVARVCLDMLRSRKSRREESLDAPGLAQPATRMEWVGGQADGVDPGQEALLADSVGLALLVVLRCWSQPSGWRSSCTTCLPCPSTRSRRSWGGRRPRRGSSPAAPAAACTERAGVKVRAGELRRRAERVSRMRATPTSTGIERWSTPSWPPREEAISRAC